MAHRNACIRCDADAPNLLPAAAAELDAEPHEHDVPENAVAVGLTPVSCRKETRAWRNCSRQGGDALCTISNGFLVKQSCIVSNPVLGAKELSTNGASFG
jgi:hypothetical protein